MTKTLGKYITEKQLERDMRTLLGSLIHTQTRLRSVLDLAEGTMSEADLKHSEAYTTLCDLNDHLERGFKELCNELGKEGKAMKRIINSKKRVLGAKLGAAEKSLLQEMISERCRAVTERYIRERDKLSMTYLTDMKKPEFRAALSQYPVLGTDPRTISYFEAFDSLYLGHHAEMRRLLCICETLALRTNPLLDHVLGCNAQSHRREPQV